MQDLIIPGFWSLMGMGVLGMAAHWLKRWAYGQTDESLKKFFMGNRRAMFGSGMTLAGLLVGMLAVGIQDITNVHLWTAFLAGYNLNSVMANSPGHQKK